MAEPSRLCGFQDSEAGRRCHFAAGFFRRCNLPQFTAIYLGRLRARFCPCFLSIYWKSTTYVDSSIWLARVSHSALSPMHSPLSTPRSPFFPASSALPRRSSCEGGCKFSKIRRVSATQMEINTLCWECKPNIRLVRISLFKHATFIFSYAKIEIVIDQPDPMEN